MNLRLLFLGPLIFGAALAAAPPLRPNPNLAKAIDEADLIIVGKVQQGTAYAIGSEMSSDLVLRIERVLKGSAVVGTDIAAVLKGRGAFIIPNGSTNKVAGTDRFCWMGGPPEEAARLTGHVAFWKAWWQAHQSEALTNSR